MRSIIVIAFLLALLAPAQSEFTATNCYLVLNEQVGFNLLPWSESQKFNFSVNANAANETSYFLNVGFCSAYFPNNTFGNINFTQTNQSFLFNKPPQYTALSGNNISNGFTVTYNSTQGNNSAQVNFTFQCNTSVGTTNSSYFNANGSGIYPLGNGSEFYNVSIIVQSEYGCGASLSELIAFLGQYKFIFIPVFFILGVFFCFFGRRTFDIALFLIVAMAGLLISGSLFMQLTTINSAASTKWVVFAICILIGVGLGYLAIKFEKAGFFGLGLVLGVVGGFFLYQLILSPILSGHNTSSSTGTIVFWVVVVILGVIGGYIGMTLSEDIKIISTAIIGSYVMVRSISVLIPNSFPPEIQVAEGTAQFTPIAYVYLALIIIIAIAGIYVQFKHKKQEDDDKLESNPESYTNNIPDYA